jgi:hypothetical protein
MAVLAGKTLRRWHEGQLVPFIFGRLRLLGEIKTLNQHRRQLSEMKQPIDLASWKVENRFWG